MIGTIVITLLSTLFTAGVIAIIALFIYGCFKESDEKYELRQRQLEELREKERNNNAT